VKGGASIQVGPALDQLHQHFAPLSRLQEPVVDQRVEVFDVINRAVDLAVETARRRFMETPVAQPVEVDCCVLLGGKEEGIHGGPKQWLLKT
jgi:hypothetical protein